MSLVVVVSIVALYVILLIVCVRYDRLERRKRYVVFLKDDPFKDCTQKYVLPLCSILIAFLTALCFPSNLQEIAIGNRLSTVI